MTNLMDRDHVKNHKWFKNLKADSAAKEKRIRKHAQSIDLGDSTGKPNLSDMFSSANRLGLLNNSKKLPDLIKTAILTAREVIDQFDFPISPAITYLGVKNVKTAGTTDDVLSGTIVLMCKFATVGGLKQSFDVPVQVVSGKVLPPSVIKFNGRDIVLAQSSVNAMVQRASSYELIPVRKQFSAPLTRDERESATELRNEIGYQAREGIGPVSTIRRTYKKARGNGGGSEELSNWLRGVVLIPDCISDDDMSSRGNGQIDLRDYRGDSKTVYVAVVHDGSGFNPGAALSVSQTNGDSALEKAFELLEEFERDSLDPETREEYFRTEEEEGFNPLTETFDGAVFTMTPQEFKTVVDSEPKLQVLEFIDNFEEEEPEEGGSFEKDSESDLTDKITPNEPMADMDDAKKFQNEPLRARKAQNDSYAVEVIDTINDEEQGGKVVNHVFAIGEEKARKQFDKYVEKYVTNRGEGGRYVVQLLDPSGEIIVDTQGSGGTNRDFQNTKEDSDLNLNHFAKKAQEDSGREDGYASLDWSPMLEDVRNNIDKWLEGYKNSGNYGWGDLGFAAALYMHHPLSPYETGGYEDWFSLPVEVRSGLEDALSSMRNEGLFEYAYGKDSPKDKGTGKALNAKRAQFDDEMTSEPAEEMIGPPIYFWKDEGKGRNDFDDTVIGRIFQWHGGQDTQEYELASSWQAGYAVPKSLVESVIDSLNYLGEEEAKELASDLQEILAYPGENCYTPEEEDSDDEEGGHQASRVASMGTAIPGGYEKVKELMDKAQDEGKDTFPRSWIHVLRNYLLEVVSTASQDAWATHLVNDGYVLNPYGSNNRGREKTAQVDPGLSDLSYDEIMRRIKETGSDPNYFENKLYDIAVKLGKPDPNASNALVQFATKFVDKSPISRDLIEGALRALDKHIDNEQAYAESEGRLDSEEQEESNAEMVWVHQTLDAVLNEQFDKMAQAEDEWNDELTMDEPDSHIYDGTKTPMEPGDSVKFQGHDGAIRGTVVEVNKAAGNAIVKAKGYEYRVALEDIQPLNSTFKKMWSNTAFRVLPQGKKYSEIFNDLAKNPEIDNPWAATWDARDKDIHSGPKETKNKDNTPILKGNANF